MRMRRNGICAAVSAVLMIILCCFSLNISGEEIQTPYIEVTDIELADDFSGIGNVCITGYMENACENAQITILLMTGESAEGEIVSGDEIVYMNQMTAGNNGVFMFEFAYDDRFDGETATLRIGGTDVDEPYRADIVLPYIDENPTVDMLPDNTVIYGCDAYKMSNNEALSSENVRDGILSGGNRVYFKLGGYWYDLLSPDATSAAYMIPENAVSDETLSGIDMRWYWYSESVRRDMR